LEQYITPEKVFLEKEKKGENKVKNGYIEKKEVGKM